MNLKQFVENHVIVILFVTLVTGFAAGWGAYVAVQNAAGLTSVSNDHLKELERHATFGREDLERENGIYRERISNLEAENGRIRDALLENRPTGKSYVKNVSLSPKSPDTITINKKIVIKFDYVIAEGEYAYIAVVSEYTNKEDTKNIGDEPTGVGYSAIRFVGDDSKLHTAQEELFISLGGIKPPAIVSPPVKIMSGSGSAEKNISLLKPGKLNTVHIIINSASSGEMLYKMSIPVTYTFK